MTHQQIEIKLLDRSPLNVRKTDSHAAMDELKASIVAHGLMQNLVVIPAKKGRFDVIAGGRRLEALRALVAEGKLPEDFAVPCRVADPAEAAELSLAENIVRQAMHPADEFEAFADLIGKGQTAIQVAERFGVEEKHVFKRLKLGRVAPELLAAYRAEELSLDCLMAFAVTDDRKKQMSVFKSLSGWQRDSERHIRGCLTETMVEGDDKLAVFVGLEAYIAAGGRTKADLFEDTSYLENADLLQRLAGEKLDEAAERLKAVGWGWVAVSIESDYSFTSRCGHLKPVPVDAPAELLTALAAAEAEQLRIGKQIDATEDEEELDALYEKDREVEDRLDELAEQIESHSRFDPEQMKVAGCYITISHDGELRVETGLVKPEDKTKLGDEEGAGTYEAAKGKPVFARPLFDDLHAVRTHVARLELAKHPQIAFDLMAFTMAKGVLDIRPSTGPEIHLSQQFPKPKVGDIDKLEQQWEAVEKSLPAAWLKEKTEVAQFRAFQKLGTDEKLAILAYCTGEALRPRQFVPDAKPQDCAYEEALSQTGGDVAAYWRPTKDNFLNRVSRTQLVEMGGEVFPGNGYVESRFRNAKKTALVAEFGEAFAKSGHPNTIDTITQWLPTGMAFRKAQPETTKTKKSKKAA